MGNPYAPPPTRQDGDEHSTGPESPPGEAPRGDAPPPVGRRPDAGPPVLPPPKRPKPSPEQVRASTRRVFATAGLTLGALLVTTLPLPWQALGAVFALGAIVLGISGFRLVRMAGLQRTLLPVLTVSLVLGVVYLLSSLSVIATWPIQMERQQCLERALTVSARDACETQFREALDELNPVTS